MKKIAIFASGSGTNAENIFKYFQKSEFIKVSLLMSNNKNSFSLERAKNFNIPTKIFNRNQFYKENFVIDILEKNKIDFIILAGFLWLIPDNILKNFEKKIINIHPALLPNYGGKGMFGMKIHNKIIENKEKESGISIHFVNEKYDEGEIIFQKKCKIDKNDNAINLAKNIHNLEYKYFPKIIENVILKKH
ncbi:MAG: phosphoribosylglycinamide formyltransferase [Bacteroidetes bacterium 4572_128]|nr:MAG: phosphoribosylglycinamide formyltransferase [Bacteroidetes bacterium 4572_128]